MTRWPTSSRIQSAIRFVAQAPDTGVREAISFPAGSAAVIEVTSTMWCRTALICGRPSVTFGPRRPGGACRLPADAEVQQAFGGALAGAVGILADAALEAIAADGGIVGTALTGLLSAIQGDLASAAGSALMEFLSQPGIDDALASGAVEAILAAIGGGAPDMGSVLDAAGGRSSARSARC